MSVTNIQKAQNVLKAYNFDIKDVVPVITGKFNSTFLVNLDKATKMNSCLVDRFILRIAPDFDSGYLFYEKDMMKQEPLLHRMIREKTSIPVPEIYVYDESGKYIDNSYILMEYIPGTVLSEAYVGSTDWEKILKQTGKYLNELHSGLKSNRYGYLGEHNCMVPQDSWQHAFEIMWEKLIEDVRNCNVYSGDDVNLAFKVFETHKDIFNITGDSSLLHMDIWSQNIIINSRNRIVGILDWDRALWGDPGIEFAVLEYVGFHSDYFWEGYGKIPEDTPEHRIRKVFYHLYEVQKYLVIWTLRRKARQLNIDNHRSYSLELLKKLI